MSEIELAAPLHLVLDGRPITVAAGTTLWEAATAHGIDIPVLCHDPRMRPVGVCRMCVVDLGGRVLVPSCTRPCEEGMQVQTGGERIERQRRMLAALLLADHPTPCQRERTTGDCQLERLGRKLGLISASGTLLLPSGIRASQDWSRRGQDVSSPVIAVDHQACIVCDRCVRACDEIQSNEVIGRTGKGFATGISFDLAAPMGDSTCTSCGECAASCPTGALTNKPRTLPLVPPAQTQSVDSVCAYCGVGCALTYHVQDNQIVWAEGRESPVNDRRLCVKGRYGWDYTLHEQRLTRPLIRREEFYPKGPLSDEVRDGDQGSRGVVDYAQVMPAFREATWDEALDLIARRMQDIRASHGPRALGGFGSAKCSNEEGYLYQKLMRAALGTNNLDHCSRLCHATSVVALLEAIGSGAVTDIFAHARKADLMLITGSNTTENHPVAATFFKEAVKRGTKLIVIDPRRPAMANFADWYCPLRPGMDVAFYNAVMQAMIQEGLVNEPFIRERTEGFDALRQRVAEYAPERVAPLCGIPAETIRAVARMIGGAKRMMIFWGMGVSQHTHGTDNCRALIALSLLTGNIGREGTGLHPLRGQCNVQGTSDAGVLPMFYPDYQSVASETVRKKFEAAWGAPLDPQPGLTVVEMMKAALEGRMRGMFVMGENPFLSDPNTNKVRRALSQLDFLAVADLYLSETAEFADVILPSASLLEKTGTYTNTDRRVQIGRKVLEPPGEARPDWQMLRDLSTRLGYPMQYADPQEIFAELTSLTNNYRGLTYEALGLHGKIWPCPDPEHSDGQAVLFADQFKTPSGRAKFVACEWLPAKELPDAEYPLILNTGRLLEHYLTGTMTRRSSALDARAPGPFVEIHPDDLARYGLTEGHDVTLRSRRGSIRLAALATSAVMPGSVFLPIHFREAAANLLTIDELDPYGKIPEYKFCAVRVEG